MKKTTAKPFIRLLALLPLFFSCCLTTRDWENPRAVKKAVEVRFDREKQIYKVKGPEQRSRKNPQNRTYIRSVGPKSGLRHQIYASILHQGEGCRLDKAFDNREQNFNDFKVLSNRTSFTSCITAVFAGPQFIGRRSAVRFGVSLGYLKSGATKGKGISYTVESERDGCYAHLDLPAEYIQGYLQTLLEIQ